MTTKRRPARALPYGAGRIVERPTADGTIRYQAKWTEPVPLGVEPRQRSQTFASRAEAEAHLFAINQAKRTGRYAPPSRLTVSVLIAESLERNASRRTDGTTLAYRQKADRMIAPYIGRMRVVDLTPLDVQRWVETLARTEYRSGTAYKGSSIQVAVSVLSSALTEAAVFGIIPRNVADGIRLPGIVHTDMTVWTAEQARRFLAQLGDHPIYTALYHVALSTGARPGELRALKWDAVDLDKGIVVIRRTMSKDIDGNWQVADRTKSGKPRAVAIPSTVVERLRWHRARQRERRVAHANWYDLNLVLDGGDGRWISVTTWQRFHKVICKAAGVPVIRHHDMRHTAATLLLEAGVHPKITSDMLGHSSIQMTLDRYSHVSSDLQRAASDALGARLFGAEIVGQTVGQ